MSSPAASPRSAASLGNLGRRDSSPERAFRSTANRGHPRACRLSTTIANVSGTARETLRPPLCGIF
jgi:hypothetical protein